MVRLVLFLILFIFIARTFWRVVDNIIEAAGGQPASRRGRTPNDTPAAKMARDPVCGTFVVPEHAISVADRAGRVYFCSEACRDKYTRGRARSA